MASPTSINNSAEAPSTTEMAAPRVEVLAPKPLEHNTATSSAISELQTAFSSLLHAQKDKEPLRLPSASFYPRWTGSFELLCFPREMRDRIYFHYLYRPAGIMFDRRFTPTFPFDQGGELACLFRTCRQVHDEALAIFWRYNAIVFSGSPWRKRTFIDHAFESSLRLFPEENACLLQRARKQYHENTHIYPRLKYKDAEQVAGEGFVQMLRDAYTFKSVFAKLRDFTVAWQASPAYFEEQVNLRFEGKTEEEKVAVWLEWMQRWVADGNVVPPRWVRFEFTGLGQPQTDMLRHESAINEAYVRLVKELPLSSDETGELEEVERRRLQRLSNKGKKY